MDVNERLVAAANVAAKQEAFEKSNNNNDLVDVNERLAAADMAKQEDFEESKNNSDLVGFNETLAAADVVAKQEDIEEPADQENIEESANQENIEEPSSVDDDDVGPSMTGKTEAKKVGEGASDD